MWFFLALLSGFCAATIAILIKVHLTHINPIFISLIFTLISLVILIFLALFYTNEINYKLLTTLQPKDWKYLLITGLISSLAFPCYLFALKYGRAGHVVAIDRLGLVFTVILAAIFLKEAYSTKVILGAIMMITGAFFIVS